MAGEKGEDPRSVSVTLQTQYWLILYQKVWWINILYLYDQQCHWLSKRIHYWLIFYQKVWPRRVPCLEQYTYQKYYQKNHRICHFWSIFCGYFLWYVNCIKYNTLEIQRNTVLPTLFKAFDKNKSSRVTMTPATGLEPRTTDTHIHRPYTGLEQRTRDI